MQLYTFSWLAAINEALDDVELCSRQLSAC